LGDRKIGGIARQRNFIAGTGKPEAQTAIARDRGDVGDRSWAVD
jgi:hypothetical protein